LAVTSCGRQPRSWLDNDDVPCDLAPSIYPGMYPRGAADKHLRISIVGGALRPGALIEAPGARTGGST